MTPIGERDLRRRRWRQNELPAVARRHHHPVQLGVPLRRAVARGRRVLFGRDTISLFDTLTSRSRPSAR